MVHKEKNSYHNCDEDLYEKAVNELKLGSFSEALWAKALAKSSFDENKAKAKYVDLRVQQMKELIRLENETVEKEIETQILAEELKTIKKKVRKAQRDLEDVKLNAIIENVITSPLLMLQVVLLSGAAGSYWQSWIIFFTAFFGLCLIFIVPVISSLASFLFSCLFAYVGYELGTEWFDVTVGYWAGGITFLVVLGANIELIDRNKGIRNISSQVDEFE